MPFHLEKKFFPCDQGFLHFYKCLSASGGKSAPQCANGMATGLASVEEQDRHSPLQSAGRTVLWLQIGVISFLTCVLFGKVLIDMAP